MENIVNTWSVILESNLGSNCGNVVYRSQHILISINPIHNIQIFAIQLKLSSVFAA